MSHLILHIGLHKTGTTSLQNSCFARADDLAKHGLIYPRLAARAHPDGVPGHHGLTLTLAQSLPQYALEGGAEAAWAKLIAAHAASDRRILISSEEFSRGRKGFRVDMERLGQIARAFDKVTVVCVLRDQISFLQSVYQETAKLGRAMALSQMIAHTVQHNDAAGLWVDWRPLYNHLLSGFAPDQLCFIDYATASQAAGGVVGAVLALGGITYRASSPNARRNVSAPPLATLLCLPCFAPHPAPVEALNRVAAALQARFGPDRPTTLFTRDEVAMLRRHFAGPNTALVEKIRLKQPEFTLSMPEFPANTIYREDVAPVAPEVLAAAGIATTSPSAAW